MWNDEKFCTYVVLGNNSRIGYHGQVATTDKSAIQRYCAILNIYVIIEFKW